MKRVGMRKGLGQTIRHGKAREPKRQTKDIDSGRRFVPREVA
jgi:hypothetical protein